jgi:uncharacterized protein
MLLNAFLKERRGEFVTLCQKHNVKKMYAFGSSITERFDEAKSDIDIFVDIDINDPVQRGETLLLLWDALELFFGRKVDLLTEGSLGNPYLKANIERNRKLIYDREGKEVFV